MNTLVNKYDSLEELIYSEGIRIKTIDLHPDLDTFLIILNTGAVLKESLSKYSRLRNASYTALQNYELIGQGTGIHWVEVDEDLSLKGFLREAIRNQVINEKVA